MKFWKRLKKNRKRYRIILISIIVLLIAFFGTSLFFGFRIQFIIKDELEIGMEVSEPVVNLKHDESQNITLKLDTRNFRLCRINCTLEYLDLSRNQTVLTSQINLAHNENYEISLPINANRQGTGQALYQVNAACSNIRSRLCRTDSPLRFETSNILLKHDLTESERSIKEQIKESLETLRKLIANVTQKQELAEQIYFKITALSPQARETLFIMQKLNASSIQINSAQAIEKTLTRAWNNQDYNSIPANSSEAISDLEMQFTEINFVIDFEYYTLNLYNNTILTVENLFEARTSLLEAAQFYLQRGSVWNQKVIEELDNLEQIISDIESKSFSSFAQIYERTNELQKQTQLILEKYDTDQNAALRFGAYHLSRDAIVAEEILNNWENRSNELFSLANLSEYSNLQISDLCRSIEHLASAKSRISSINSLLEITYLENLTNASINGSMLKDETEVLLSNTQRDADNSILTLAESTSDKGLLNLLLYKNQRTLKDFNPAYPELYPKYYFGLLDFEISQTVINFNNTYCADVQMPNISMHSDFDMQPVQLSIEPVSITAEPVPENDALCCAFGDCTSCCKEQECQGTYPILMIHGHAFREETSPEASLNIFGMLQRNLQKSGIINGGALNLELGEKVISNFWSGFNSTVSFRASYYYIRYFDIDQYSIVAEKSESIENYALRLREIIEQALAVSGRDKVTLIAHSMGGLVAREYIALFGDGKIDKLIMIGTPNQGITDDIYSYCQLSGSKVECDDMKKGSVFLKRLNAPINSDYGIPVYNIIGQGCSMNGADGDGIVTVENAQLPGAETMFVNGSCTDFFNVELHNALVNKQKTLEHLEKILQET